MGYADLGVCGSQQRKLTVERLWKIRSLIATLRRAVLFYTLGRLGRSVGRMEISRTEQLGSLARKLHVCPLSFLGFMLEAEMALQGGTGGTEGGRGGETALTQLLREDVCRYLHYHLLSTYYVHTLL